MATTPAPIPVVGTPPDYPVRAGTTDKAAYMAQVAAADARFPFYNNELNAATAALNAAAGVTYDNALAAAQSVADAEEQVSLAANQADRSRDEAERSETAAELATGVINYRGRWDEQTGAATAGGTYEYEGAIWLLLVDVADIALSEPSRENTDWLATGANFGQKIGQIVYSFQELDALPYGFYVRTAQAYLQSEYPDLFNVIGLGNALPINKLPNPSQLPANTGRGVAFSSDNNYMAVGHNASPFIAIYKRDGDTFNKLPNPSQLPTNTAWGVAFSSDNTFMAVGHSNSPFITIYKRDGDTFNKLPNPSELPADRGFGVAFSSDNTFMAVAHFGSPYIAIYKGDYPFDIETEFYVPDVDDLPQQQIGDWLPSVQGRAYVRAK